MKNMCQVEWAHASLFVTGRLIELACHLLKVTMMLICLSSVNWQVLKLPTTLSDTFKSSHAKVLIQK